MTVCGWSSGFYAVATVIGGENCSVALNFPRLVETNKQTNKTSAVCAVYTVQQQQQQQQQAMAFTATDLPDEVLKMKATQRLYLLLPNHKCPQKDCPFHPPEDKTKEEEEPEEETLTKLQEIGAGVQQGGLMSAPPPPPPPPKKPPEAEPEDDGVSKDYFSEITIDSDYESTMTLDSGFGRERDELSDTGEYVSAALPVSPDLHRLEPELAHIEEDDDEVMTLTSSEPVPLEDVTEHDADDERVTPVLVVMVPSLGAGCVSVDRVHPSVLLSLSLCLSVSLSLSLCLCLSVSLSLFPKARLF